MSANHNVGDPYSIGLQRHSSGSLINTNMDELDLYSAQKLQHLATQKKLEKLDLLQKELGEVKDLLTELLGK